MHVAWGSSHHWVEFFAALKSFKWQLVNIVTPALTGLAFSAGPYGGIVNKK